MSYFVTPSIPDWFGKAAQAHYRRTGEALLLHNANYTKRIEASNCSGKIYLEDPDAPTGPPSMTWREFVEEYVEMTLEDYDVEYDLPESEWDEEADPNQVHDHWVENGARREAASGSAYCMLEFLDLGQQSLLLDDIEIEQILGYIMFIDGDSPGRDVLAVLVSSPTALAALQYRLNELGTGIKIEMV
ncbi:hypothetical protein HQ496_03910 [bacterium]|nr:hypothetical protein [bacterium]